jgi:hypothetical protein
LPISALPIGEVTDMRPWRGRPRRADDLVLHLLVGVLVGQPHRGAELRDLARELAEIDHLGAGDDVLDLGNAALDEALALARGGVFGILRDVAVLARRRDRLDDRRALHALELF